MQDQGGASVRHTHSSELAEPALVSGLDRAADSPPLADSGQEGHVISIDCSSTVSPHLCFYFEKRRFLLMFFFVTQNFLLHSLHNVVLARRRKNGKTCKHVIYLSFS